MQKIRGFISQGNKSLLFKAYLAYSVISLLVGGILYLKENNLKERNYNNALIKSNLLLKRSDYDPFPCLFNRDCNHGKCEVDTDAYGNGNNTICVCDNGYISIDDEEICDYHQISILVAFLVSFFVGSCGIDWCILARGNGVYICAGVCKGLTLGGIYVWWLVDWIRILTYSFDDGNGRRLCDWSCS